MEDILEKLELIIDDIERDSQITKDEIYDELIKWKTKIEDYQLSQEERGGSLEWDDLD